MNTVEHYLTLPDPGEGTGPRHSSGGLGLPRPDRTTIAAVLLLSGGEAEDGISWGELLDGFELAEKRRNAWGDAISKKSGCCLDRTTGNKIARTEANMTRCAIWLKDHAKATPKVAEFLSIEAGDDLLQYVEARLHDAVSSEPEPQVEPEAETVAAGGE